MQLGRLLQATPAEVLLQRCGATRCPPSGCTRLHEQEEPTAQRPRLHRLAVDEPPSEAPPVVHEVLRSAGQPLPPATLSVMESVFGRDLSHVRIHTGARARESARAVGAQAFTVGADVVVGNADIEIGTPDGRRLLAHELTHVVQQRSSTNWGNGTCQRLAVAPADDTFESEAERISTLVSRWPLDTPSLQPVSRTDSRGGTATYQPPVVQRACPPTPTGLGRTPAPACERRPPAVVGGSPILQFCQDSDELVSGQETYLGEVVRDALHAVKLEIHGNASLEGPSAEYNYNLACTRASRIAARLQAAGVTAPIALFSHGPVTAFGGAAANRNVEIVIHGPAKTEDHHRDEACVPRAGILNTVCGAYRAQDWWLPEAYVINATCACETTPNEPTANCVRKFLQDRLAATSSTVIKVAAVMKVKDPLTTLGLMRAVLDPYRAAIDGADYEAFVQAVLTPLIYKDHFDAYKTCCCPSGPARYGAWMVVTTIPLTCAITGTAIAEFGSCHGTPGKW